MPSETNFTNTLFGLKVPDSFELPKIFLSLFGIWFAFNFVEALFTRDTFGSRAPYVGPSVQWLPGFVKRLLFHTNANAIINTGYVQFKNSIFRIMRNDYDLVVLSTKYVEELRVLPDTKLSSIRAHIMNLAGKYSTTDILIESPLHTQTLQTRLTPNLGLLVPPMHKEFLSTISSSFSTITDTWTPLPVFPTILHIIAQVSASIFVSPLANNPAWLHGSIHYTENLFLVVYILKLIPTFLWPFVAPCIPAYWRIHYYLRSAKAMVSPIVLERRKAAAENPNWQPPFDFLQWMMEEAKTAEEQNPEKLAHRLLLVSLASIHTTTMCTTHVIYDLAQYPEYIEPLRQEVLEAVEAEGGWNKQTINRLKLMDSFIKESQRVNPPSLLSFHRVVVEPVTLADGTFLPKNTQICMPSGPLGMDSTVLVGDRPPTDFDGYRYFNERKKEGEGHRHQFAMPQKDHLHFGIGRYACPGRFLAANEVKMLLGTLLQQGYEWKFKDGTGRPKNWNMEEKIVPHNTAKLLFRKLKQ
ncbi:putative cytochrome P450 [Pyronema omphalodes]|nr:putative cytochrome P450 [Pyronema omphalodes]